MDKRVLGWLNIVGVVAALACLAGCVHAQIGNM